MHIVRRKTNLRMSAIYFRKFFFLSLIGQSIERILKVDFHQPESGRVSRDSRVLVQWGGGGGGGEGG